MLSENLFRDGSLCVVGNINRDVKAAPFVATSSLLQDGETSLDWTAETIGGGGANSACAASALGGRVSFIGKVGKDGLADRLERTLERCGINVRLIRDNTVATGTSLALSFNNGHRHFLSCLPASRNLSFRDLDLTVLAGHQHLLRADIWFSEPMLFEGNKLLFERALNSGLRTSIDINFDPAWNSGNSVNVSARKQAVRNVLPLVSLAHGNIRELCAFADASDLTMALKFIHSWGAEAVIVHMSEQGAGYSNGYELIIEPPVLARTRTNTTGTGDVLSVCMMLLDRSGATIREQLRLANQIVSEFIDGRRRLIPGLED